MWSGRNAETCYGCLRGRKINTKLEVLSFGKAREEIEIDMITFRFHDKSLTWCHHTLAGGNPSWGWVCLSLRKPEDPLGSNLEVSHLCCIPEHVTWRRNCLPKHIWPVEQAIRVFLPARILSAHTACPVFVVEWQSESKNSPRKRILGEVQNRPRPPSPNMGQAVRWQDNIPRGVNIRV